jgi:hypothetical protein
MSRRVAEILDTIEEFLRRAGRRELSESGVRRIRQAAVARVATRLHIQGTTVTDKWRRQLGRQFAGTKSIDQYLLAMHRVSRLRRTLAKRSVDEADKDRLLEMFGRIR